MNKVLRTSLLAALITPTLTAAPLASAQEKFREDLYYVGVLGSLFNYRSVLERVPLEGGGRTQQYNDGWGSGVTLVAGDHISELFHVELRLGGGFKEADIGNTGASLNVDFFASWYIGLHYHLGEGANIYGQFGFSYIGGDADLPNEEARYAFPQLQEEFPESAFSKSWIAGLDYEVLDNVYFVLEGGNLFEDTLTEVNTFQFNSGVRYEF
ncbi:outer membrane beta-barrel protein [Marinobacter sp. F4216]|uniref:outer membrane beta-barrel protein n=1 Tax=Marinobacter sp. F4216 TaxID=2874281 RepID=UPI001CBFB833|nr:outer membrane beta-barrel protein [Marinobacter sp. F4216]MBZ2169967.1 porin family protein [Marinobacter sp. F4216]